MSSEQFVLKELKQREKMLLEQLAKVREMIEAFGGDGTIEGYADIENASDFGVAPTIEDKFDIYATYDEKIIWSLRNLRKPAYVKEIVEHLRANGEVANHEALTKRVTYNASRLCRTGVLDADKRQKQYKYSIKKSAFTFVVQ